MTLESPSKPAVRNVPWWVGALAIPIGFVLFAIVSSRVTALVTGADYNYDTDTARLLVQGIPSSVILSVALLWLWRWSGWRLQGPKIRWTTEVWLMVGAYLALGVLTFVNGFRSGAALNSKLLVGVAIAAMLVGINEELAFRGFAINGFARKLPAFWAVVAAAVVFGLAHTSNLLAGSEPSKVAAQVALTTLSGLGFGWIYLFSGRNLWLVAIAHGVHDIFAVAPATFVGGTADVAPGLDTLLGSAQGLAGGFVQAGLPVLLTTYAWAQFRGKTLEEVLGLESPQAQER
jgi:membrane protease YdiL (CAAX protease family)